MYNFQIKIKRGTKEYINKGKIKGQSVLECYVRLMRIYKGFQYEIIGLERGF